MAELKMVKFKINQSPLFAKKLDLNENLFQIRKKYEDKLPKESLFVCSDGTKIEKEDEQSFNLKDIIEEIDKSYFLHLIVENENDKKDEKNSNVIKKQIIDKNNLIDADREVQILDDEEGEEKEEGEEEEEDEEKNEQESNETDLPSWLFDKNDVVNKINLKYKIYTKTTIKESNKVRQTDKNKYKDILYPSKDITKNKDKNCYKDKKIQNQNYITPTMTNRNNLKLNKEKSKDFNPPPAANNLSLIYKENSKNKSKFNQKNLLKYKLIEKKGNL